MMRLLVLALLCPALFACSSEVSVSIAPEVQLTAKVVEPTLSEVNGVQQPTVNPNDSDSAPANTDGQEFGPIVGPEYTQPPTNTPKPPTATPVVTQPGSAYTTPVAVDQTRLDPAQMGIQLHYDYDVDTWEYRLQQIKPLRVNWVKVQAAWKWLQPDRGGQFDRNFRLFQLHVQKADKYGFQVMLSIVKAPEWTRHTNRNEDGPPDDLNQFAAFLRQLLEQLGPYIDAIEIWNEPNLRREWTGSRPISGASYMELFRVAYDAIRAYSPQYHPDHSRAGADRQSQRRLGRRPRLPAPNVPGRPRALRRRQNRRSPLRLGQSARFSLLQQCRRDKAGMTNRNSSSGRPCGITPPSSPPIGTTRKCG